MKVIVVGNGSTGFSKEVIQTLLNDKGIVANIEVVENINDIISNKDEIINHNLLLKDIDTELNPVEIKKCKKLWKKSFFYE
jgi:hypothetical protein